MISKLLLWLIVAFSAGVTTACNPLTTNGCPSIPGLPTSSYSVDFTKEKSLPKDWILADASDISFGSKGIEFNFRKRKDAPYIWTNFYVAYGRIDVEMQVARGTGLITSAVMFSDDNDEIDWEFSGSNFGAGSDNGKVQTNVFGKGITGNYDRGTQFELSPPPQSAFHTYTINWTPEKIEWILNGVTKYTEKNNGLRTGNYQFPQTPSRLHLGVWDAGDPETAGGTRQWAGGFTDYSKCPYVAYVKTVKISTPYPCKAWKYPDNFSGNWADVQCTNETVPSSTSASLTSSSARPKSTEASYAVVAGDNGYSIADKLGCTFDQLAAVNPNVKWDFLDIGQKLNNPGFEKQTTLLSSSGLTTSSLKSSITNASAATSTVPITTTPRICSSDECYNSMVATQFATSALSFCSGYNKTNALGITPPIPTFLSGCNGNTTRIKSACDCLSNVPSTTTSGSTSSSIGPTATQVSSTSSTWIIGTSSTTMIMSSGANTTSTVTQTVSTSSTSPSTTTITSITPTTSTVTKTPSTTKTTSKMRKTTPAKTSTTSRQAWNVWPGYNGGRGWGGWKREERPRQHADNHRFGRTIGGQNHA